MKKSFAICFLLSLLSTRVFCQVSLDNTQSIISKEVEGKRSKSIIVGIVDVNGRKVFAEGIKSDENPIKPDENTIYEIGSITKVFTSLVLSKMYLRGELALNDPISKFLPKGIKTPFRNGKEISLLNLATHTSGMPRFPYNVSPKDLDQPYNDYGVNKLYEYIDGFQPTYDIGSRWKYSNIGYGVLGRVITLVSGKKFESLVIEEICNPLQLGNTVITLNDKQRSNMAVGHTEAGMPVEITQLGEISAGGALRSNINDLLTFAEANLGLKETPLFPAMELTHIARVKKDGDDTFNTMGWTLVSEGLLFKDGGMPGFRTFIGIDKKNKRGVVVLSNSNNSVTDIGRFILEKNKSIDTYVYPWGLLDTLRNTLKANGVDKAIARYGMLKKSNPGAFVFNENQLNYLGNELRSQKEIKDALKVYDLNLTEYPKSILAYESLGETYRLMKKRKKATFYFSKAQSLDPENPHWSYLLKVLR